MAIFGIVLTLVVSIIAVLSASTYRSLNVSQQTNSAQVSVSRTEQFLTGVVPPMVAATSTFPSSSATSVALGSSTPCWGTSQPASTTLPSTPGTVPAGTIPANGQTLTFPSRASISMAHDYDMVWCGYAPNSSTANVYEASLSGCSGTYGNCTFTINSFGPGCVPGVGSPASNGSSSGCSAASPVLVLSHIWCDSYCQGSSGATMNTAGTSVPVACIDVTGNTQATCANNTPPLFSYFAGGNGRYTTTINNASLNGTTSVTFESGATPGISAGMSVTGVGIPTGTTVSSVASGSGDSYTLTLSATATVGSALTPVTENLTIAGTNYLNTLNYTVANEKLDTSCPTGTQYFLDLAQSVSNPSTCYDPATFLPGIQDVTLNLTLLSNNGTPGGSNATGKASTSSATIDNQILLANQLQANQSCGATTFEYPPDLTSFFPLDSAANPLTDLGQTNNDTSQTDVQMQYTNNTSSPAYNSNGTAANPTLTTSGPLACNSASTPGTAFNGTSQYAVDNYWDQVTPATACALAIPCLWGTSSSTGMTVVGWVQVPTETVAATRERILSNGNASGNNSTTGAPGGIELALKPASSTCGEQANGTNLSGLQPGGIVASIDGGSWYQCLPNGLVANTWYFVAATFDWSGTTPTATVYISGSSANNTVGTVPDTLGTYYPNNTPGCPLLIGAAANSTFVTTNCNTTGVPADFFLGDIADVATYSTVLSGNQIQTLYNELSQ